MSFGHRLPGKYTEMATKCKGTSLLKTCFVQQFEKIKIKTLNLRFSGWSGAKTAFFFFFFNMFYSGNVVLQIISCYHNTETQEINIHVCMRTHSLVLSRTQGKQPVDFISILEENKTVSDDSRDRMFETPPTVLTRLSHSVLGQ